MVFSIFTPVDYIFLARICQKWLFNNILHNSQPLQGLTYLLLVEQQSYKRCISDNSMDNYDKLSMTCDEHGFILLFY